MCVPGVASMGGRGPLVNLGRGFSEGRRSNQIVAFLVIAFQQCLVHSVPLIVGYLGMLDYPVESLALL